MSDSFSGRYFASQPSTESLRDTRDLFIAAVDKCYKYIRDAAKDRHEDMAEHFVEMSDQFMDHGEDYAAYMNQSVKELEASIKNQFLRLRKDLRCLRGVANDQNSAAFEQRLNEILAQAHNSYADFRSVLSNRDPPHCSLPHSRLVPPYHDAPTHSDAENFRDSGRRGSAGTLGGTSFGTSSGTSEGTSLGTSSGTCERTSLGTSSGTSEGTSLGTSSGTTRRTSSGSLSDETSLGTSYGTSSGMSGGTSFTSSSGGSAGTSTGLSSRPSEGTSYGTSSGTSGGTSLRSSRGTSSETSDGTSFITSSGPSSDGPSGDLSGGTYSNTSDGTSRGDISRVTYSTTSTTTSRRMPPIADCGDQDYNEVRPSTASLQSSLASSADSEPFLRNHRSGASVDNQSRGSIPTSKSSTATQKSARTSATVFSSGQKSREKSPKDIISDSSVTSRASKTLRHQDESPSRSNHSYKSVRKEESSRSLGEKSGDSFKSHRSYPNSVRMPTSREHVEETARTGDTHHPAKGARSGISGKSSTASTASRRSRPDLAVQKSGASDQDYDVPALKSSRNISITLSEATGEDALSEDDQRPLKSSLDEQRRRDSLRSISVAHHAQSNHSKVNRNELKPTSRTLLTENLSCVTTVKPLPSKHDSSKSHTKSDLSPEASSSSEDLDVVPSELSNSTHRTGRHPTTSENFSPRDSVQSSGESKHTQHSRSAQSIRPSETTTRHSRDPSTKSLQSVHSESTSKESTVSVDPHLGDRRSSRRSVVSETRSGASVQSRFEKMSSRSNASLSERTPSQCVLPEVSRVTFKPTVQTSSEMSARSVAPGETTSHVSTRSRRSGHRKDTSKMSFHPSGTSSRTTARTDHSDGRSRITGQHSTRSLRPVVTSSHISGQSDRSEVRSGVTSQHSTTSQRPTVTISDTSGQSSQLRTPSKITSSHSTRSHRPAKTVSYLSGRSQASSKRSGATNQHSTRSLRLASTASDVSRHSDRSEPSDQRSARSLRPNGSRHSDRSSKEACVINSQLSVHDDVSPAATVSHLTRHSDRSLRSPHSAPFSNVPSHRSAVPHIESASSDSFIGSHNREYPVSEAPSRASNRSSVPSLQYTTSNVSQKSVGQAASHRTGAPSHFASAQTAASTGSFISAQKSGDLAAVHSSGISDFLHPDSALRMKPVWSSRISTATERSRTSGVSGKISKQLSGSTRRSVRQERSEASQTSDASLLGVTASEQSERAASEEGDLSDEGSPASTGTESPAEESEDQESGNTETESPTPTETEADETEASETEGSEEEEDQEGLTPSELKARKKKRKAIPSS